VKRTVLTLLILAASGYLLLLGLLFVFQGKLIYLASGLRNLPCSAPRSGSGLQPWRDRSGAIIGWRRPNPGAQNRIVVFHGNAGHALHRAHFIEALGGLDRGAKWEVYLFEYPGFGARAGTPGEQAIITAGRAAVEELLAQDSRPLFLAGESLGSGAACALAGALPDRIAGVLLVMPYSALTDVAAHHYGFIPVQWILRTRFDNVGALRGYRGPVAFVVAGEDEVVTTEGGLRLHETYAGPKRLLVIPGIGHNELDYSPGAGWWRDLTGFLLANQR
jgi:pimeloyl-ACP methyl ester carboxylesterase